MKRILVALDDSPRAPKVLDAAVRLAELTGAKLVMYHAIGVTEHPREPPDQRLEDVLTENARASLVRITEHVPAELRAEIVTGFASPWDGICRAAREHDVDLIVIGSHGYRGIDRLIGTVAAKVVNHADRNVLVVRSAL
jgi:universal stress protein F